MKFKYDPQIENEHSALLDTRKMQIKTTLRLHRVTSPQSEWPSKRKQIK